jgi:hypothetical protein
VTNRSGAKAYFFRSFRITLRAACLLRLDWTKHIDDLALGFDSAPEIDHPPIDFQIDFVKMPSPVRLRVALAQVRGDHRPKVAHPAAYGLVRDRDPALSEQILDVAEAEREPQIEPNCLIYDLRREPISSITDFPRAPRLPRLRRSNKLASA